MNLAQWTTSTRSLVDQLKAKKRAAEQRAVAADAEARTYQEQIDVLTASLKAFDERRALPAPKPAPVDANAGERLTIRRMIEEYALANEGRVQVTETAQAWVAAGRYGDIERARSALIAELGRMAHVVRLERGVYRVLSVDGTPTAAPV